MHTGQQRGLSEEGCANRPLTSHATASRAQSACNVQDQDPGPRTCWPRPDLSYRACRRRCLVASWPSSSPAGERGGVQGGETTLSGRGHALKHLLVPTSCNLACAQPPSPPGHHAKPASWITPALLARMHPANPPWRVVASASWRLTPSSSRSFRPICLSSLASSASHRCRVPVEQ